MQELTATFEIVNRLGLHARAATKLVHTASRFTCEIRIEKDGQSANAKSVMGVLLLCGHRGARITVAALGDDAQEALDTIGQLIGERFGEPD